VKGHQGSRGLGDEAKRTELLQPEEEMVLKDSNNSLPVPSR